MPWLKLKKNRPPIYIFYVLFHLLVILLVILVIPWTPRVWANSESKKNEHEGSENKQDKSTPSTEHKETVDYNKKKSQLNSLRSKIEEADLQLQEMVKTKSHAPTEEEKRKINEQMSSLAKERHQWNIEYDRLQQELTYKYPSQGLGFHKRLGAQPPAKKEEEVSDLDRQLFLLKKKVLKKYAPLLPKTESNSQNQDPSEPDEKKPKKLRLVQ